LLSPNKSQRIKSRDIFLHPWVIGFEPKPKQEDASPRSLGNFSLFHSPKPHSPFREEHKFEEAKESLIENLKHQKRESIAEANIKLGSPNEQLISNDKSYFLFDKVLDQVNEKSREKRKKSRQEDADVLSQELNKLNENNKLHKMVSFSKNVENVNNFDMLNEISEIDKKLNEHSNKVETLHFKKNELNDAISKSKNQTYKVSVLNDEIEEIKPFKVMENKPIKEKMFEHKKSVISNKGLVSLHPVEYNKFFKEDDKDYHSEALKVFKEIDKKVFEKSINLGHSHINRPTIDNNVNYNEQLFIKKGRENARNSHKIRETKVIKDLNKE
jgi:hypothetical protein